RARRPLAACLPRAMVPPRRERRGPRARPVAGDPEAGAAARADDGQRVGRNRRRGRPGPGAPRRGARDHARAQPVPERETGKFLAQVEGRLLAMLENCPDVTLATLNEATPAWGELEYNRRVHSETGETPLARFLAGPDVGRPSPTSDALRLVFMAEEHRTQRKSDGTVSIDGVRFKLPSRYRHLDRVAVRWARWDLGHVYLVDDRTGAVLCRLFPLDRTANADGARRALEPIGSAPPA